MWFNNILLQNVPDMASLKIDFHHFVYQTDSFYQFHSYAVKGVNLFVGHLISTGPRDPVLQLHVVMLMYFYSV